MPDLIADPFRAARLVLHLRKEGVTDRHVLAAMETISRAAFTDQAAGQGLAFEDAVLAIPCGQVMLRPSVTGHMLQALGLTPGGTERALLVGFGAGYMTALLAALCGHVYSLERYRRLTEEGRARLARLGLGNVTLRQGDGLEGWAEQGPFGAILLAGEVSEVPDALLGQLARGGVLVAAVSGPEGQSQLIRAEAGGGRQVSPLFQKVAPLREGRAQVL